MGDRRGLEPQTSTLCSWPGFGNRGSHYVNLLADQGFHVARQHVRLWTFFPCGDGALRGLGHDLLERARGHARRVGKAAYLIGCNSAQAAAVPEAQREFVAGKIRERRHEIIGG